MTRIITFNANGIRSADKKGFFNWFAGQDADVLCIQELKAQAETLPEHLLQLPGYESRFHFAEKKGYSGCALYTRLPAKSWEIGMGVPEFDSEGRFVAADLGFAVVISCYFPSGTSGDERQAAKYRFLEAIVPVVDGIRNSGRQVVLCGDMNIAHKEIDLKNWKGNLDHSGFLPQERAWMTEFLDQHGWVDVFRRLDPNPGRYTWWSQRGKAREKNVGWRIDYQLATPQIADRARQTSIYADEKFSDHAPLIIDYDV